MARASCADYGDVTMTVGFSEAGEAIAKQFARSSTP
jgi:hypothetical protein